MKALLGRFFAFVGWYGLRLGTRLLLAQALVCALLLGGLIAMSAWAFREDKTAYVYDVVALRSERISRSVLLALERAAFRRTAVSRTEALALAKESLLPRLPRQGEFFVVKPKKRTLLVLTAEGDEGPYTTFPLPRQALDGELTTQAWWSVGNHVLLGTTPVLAPRTTRELLDSTEVSRYLSSGLSRGLLTLEGQGGDKTLSGFEEVPRTNTVVFVTTSLREAMAPLRRFLVGAVVLGAAVILAGLGLLALVFRSLWRPVDRVAEISDRVARGDYAFEIAYDYKDEMKVIFDRLARMAHMLSSREAGLRRLARTVEGSLETTRAMTLEVDPLRAVAQVHARLERHLRFDGEPTGHLFLVDEGGAVESRSFPDVALPAQLRSRLDAFAASLAASRASAPGEAGPPATGAEVVPFLDGEPYVRLAVAREGKLLVHFAGPLASSTPAPEDVFLCRSLCTSLGVVLENLDLRGAAAEQARLESELATAEAMQQNMIRVECDDPRLDVGGRCLPAARVGGDWCGVFRSKRDDCIYAYVADVSGHGVDSSLVSAAACGVMESLCGLMETGAVPELAGPPDERLPAMARRINASLVTIGRRRYAMTLALACVEPGRGRLTWISCGHTPPWLVPAGGGTPTTLPSRGSLLGMSEEVQFDVKSRAFGEGDTLFLYTDGLLENEGPDGKGVSPRALRKALDALRGVGAREGLEAILAFQASVLAGRSPEDDTTCLVVRFLEEETRVSDETGTVGCDEGSYAEAEAGAA